MDSKIVMLYSKTLEKLFGSSGREKKKKIKSKKQKK